MPQSFREKPDGDGAWINGDFFVVEPEVIDYINDDATAWEQGPMVRLAKEGNLAAYEHDGFCSPWIPCETSICLMICGIQGELPGRSGR